MYPNFLLLLLLLVEVVVVVVVLLLLVLFLLLLLSYSGVVIVVKKEEEGEGVLAYIAIMVLLVGLKGGVVVVDLTSMWLLAYCFPLPLFVIVVLCIP